MAKKMNDIPYDPDKTPEEKGKEFDKQVEENTGTAEVKRQLHKYPYDLDTPERRQR